MPKSYLVFALFPLLASIYLSERVFHVSSYSYVSKDPIDFTGNDHSDVGKFEKNFLFNEDDAKPFTSGEDNGDENMGKEDTGDEVIVEEIKDESGEEPEGKKLFKITPMLKSFKPDFMKSKGSYDLTDSPGSNSEIYYGTEPDGANTDNSAKKAKNLNPFSKISSLNPFQTMKKGLKKARSKIFSNKLSEADQTEPNTSKSPKTSFKNRFRNKFQKAPGKFREYSKRMKGKLLKAPGKFRDASRKLKSKFQQAPGKFTEAMENMKDKFQQFPDKFNGASDKVKSKVQKFPDKFNEASNKIKGKFNEESGKMKSTFRNLSSKMKARLKKAPGKFKKASDKFKSKFAKFPGKFRKVSDKFTSKFQQIPAKFNLATDKLNQATNKFNQLPSKFYGKLEPITSEVKAGFNDFKKKTEKFTPFQSLLKEFQRAITPPSREEATQNALAVKDTLEKEDQWKEELFEELNKMSYFDLRKLKPFKKWLFGDFVSYKEADIHIRNCENNQKFLRAVGKLRKMKPDFQSYEVVEQLCVFPFFSQI